jgi:pimeloyl-ACP methyl ester carboxylesterase
MFIRHEGSVLRSVAFGPGPDTVLALNGWSASWEAWQPTFEVLSTTTRCISYDTRGTGSSPAPAEGLSLSTLVDDVFRVLDAHQVDRAVLAGESLGGFIALNAALRDPSRFGGLVTVGAPPVIDPEATRALVDGARRDYPATVAFFVRLCLSEPALEHLYPWGESLFLSAPGEVAARLFEVCHGTVPDLASVAVPTIVMHGTADHVVPVSVGRHLATTIPGARLVELHDACHVPTVTRPDDVAEAIRSLF